MFLQESAWSCCINALSLDLYSSSTSACKQLKLAKKGTLTHVDYMHRVHRLQWRPSWKLKGSSNSKRMKKVSCKNMKKLSLKRSQGQLVWLIGDCCSILSHESPSCRALHGSLFLSHRPPLLHANAPLCAPVPQHTRASSQKNSPSTSSDARIP